MLGVQIVITMVVASIMSKVGPYLSFARWMLTSSGLVRYIHPSDEELKELALIPKPDKKKKHKVDNFYYHSFYPFIRFVLDYMAISDRA